MNEAMLAQLRCPITGQELEWIRSESVLVSADGATEYPIDSGIPLLFRPHEQRGYTKPERNVPDYSATINDNQFYDQIALNIDSLSYAPFMRGLVAASRADQLESFPHLRWCDTVSDVVSQLTCYEALGSMRGLRVAQLGGNGVHALKFVVAGAAEVWHITPSLEEAECCRRVAEQLGIARPWIVVGTGEELPLASETLDRIYLGGSLHHVDTELAAEVLASKLARGGVLAASDPFQTRLHAIGTKVLGKREVEVHCKPMTDERLAPIARVLDVTASRRNGPLVRYLSIAAEKAGLNGFHNWRRSLLLLEDRVVRRVPALASFGGSLALVAKREAPQDL